MNALKRSGKTQRYVEQNNAVLKSAIIQTRDVHMIFSRGGQNFLGGGGQGLANIFLHQTTMWKRGTFFYHF